MKTIAICNHKGGVGKTALSMAIAEGLHRKGKRTLLVDLDQQMNATQQARIIFAFSSSTTRNQRIRARAADFELRRM